jgi:uncharacterized protein
VRKENMQQVTIQGRVGGLEAMLDLADDIDRCAVLCHPHPLYGGSMFDAVVTLMAQSMSDLPVGTLQFNFRGVGASQGVHDKGVGEVDDVVSVLDWLRQEKGISSILLGGYSFGAVVALNALPRCDVEKAILIAPPVKTMSAGEPGPVPLLVILGENDEIVDAHSTGEYFRQAEVLTISAADHFFAGAGPQIQTAIAGFLNGT